MARLQEQMITHQYERQGQPTHRLDQGTEFFFLAPFEDGHILGEQFQAGFLL